MSASTLEHHHGKHHAAYVKKLNELIAGTEYERSDLEIDHQGDGARPRQREKDLQQRRPGLEPRLLLGIAGAERRRRFPSRCKRIVASFGSQENFRDKFVEASVDQFGSGWAWLVAKNGKLEDRRPLTMPTIRSLRQRTGLWTCDLWEHAYYLDYQQERAKFVTAVLENVANWQFVGKRLVELDR